MPRRVFKKFAFKRHEIAERWFMAPFRHLLHDHRLWGVRRRWVVPAFAIGLFVAFMPIFGHTVLAILIALALRVNIPVAALSTWASNPATMFPMYYFAYRLGSMLLGWEMQPFAFEPTLDWLTHSFVNIWQPMLLGCFLLGVASAIAGYVGLDVLWRLSLGNYKARKRGERRDR
jgi:uncharacterized protein (DUF2062 family)